MNKFIDELRRRNVFRVAGVYAIAGWVLAQIATTLEESLGLPIWFDAVIVYYRRSSQFKAYMKTTGVLDYWHEYGFPPQCRPLGNDDFDCD